MPNFTRYAKKGDFKPVPNCACMNMVTAVIDYYKRQPKRLQTIYLNGTHWRLLNNELSRLLGKDYEPRDVIEFEGCEVKIMKSSLLQSQPMRYQFADYRDIVKGEA